MTYLRVPEQISLNDIKDKHFSLTPGMYQKVVIPTSKFQLVRELLDHDIPYEKGVEPGSMWYMKKSNTYFIRTKALQEDSCLLYPKGDSIIPINPKVFIDPRLEDGNILISKDSNVGECAMADGDTWHNHMFSGGIVRINPVINRYYLFSFLKNPLFKSQIKSKISRGSTITHAKDSWLDCVIPFPNQADDDRVIKYVSVLMEAIIDKEKEIRKKNTDIDQIIENELLENQKPGNRFIYSLPNITEIKNLTRLDVGMYSDDFKKKQFSITNYKHGSENYEGFGFKTFRGQNLQISCIGKSVYSDEPKKGYYRLVAPTDISEYRTIRQYRYLGNRKRLSLLNKGDIVFGAEGFGKGRVIIIADETRETITNIHGVVFQPKDGDPIKGIFLGCFLGFLRSQGLVDAIGAGGSGGSLAIGYLHHIQFPIFPRGKQKEIANLYSHKSSSPKDLISLNTFAKWHRQWNESLGIWELDNSMKELQRVLAEVQENIVQGNSVTVPL